MCNNRNIDSRAMASLTGEQFHISNNKNYSGHKTCFFFQFKLEIIEPLDLWFTYTRDLLFTFDYAKCIAYLNDERINVPSHLFCTIELM
jgi:hypothetical protein